MDEDIVGILAASPQASGYDRAALVVTSSRIIEVTPDGAIQAWRYADVSSLTVTGGQKKLFGLFGRDFMWLRAELSAGAEALNWLLPTANYEHNMRVGKVAEDKCRRAGIDKL